MSTITAVFKQTLWQILGKIVTSLSTFIILAIVARNYREEGTGVFTLSLTYLAIFNLLTDFGFNAHVLRKGETNWNKLLGARIIWSLFLIGLAVILLPFWPFSSSEFSKAVMFGSLTIVASAVFVTCNLIFQSKLRYDLSVIASILGTLISLIFYIYLSLQKYPISSLLLAYLLGWVFIALSSLILVKKFLSKLTPIVDFSYIKNLFKDCWPIAATLTLNVVYFRADSFLLAYFKGVSEVGIYNVSYAVFQSVLVLPAFIMNAYYPVMLKSFKAVKWVGLGLFTLASAGTLLTLSLAPLLIKILTGGGFDGSVVSLQILSLSFPAYFLSSLMMWVMVALGKYKIMLAIYAAGLVLNLSLNFIYIPQYSFLAAAWITLISEYVILIMQAVVLFSE